MQGDRPHRGGIQLAHKLGRPDRGIAGSRRTGPAGQRQRTFELGDATGPELVGELPQSGPLPAGSLQGGVATQLELPATSPAAGGGVQSAAANDPGRDAGPAAGACPAESDGEELGGRCRNQLQLGIHAPEHAPTHRANGYTPLAIARTVARLPIPIVNSEPLYGREVLRRDAGREAAQSTESERPAQTSVHAIGSIG